MSDREFDNYLTLLAGLLRLDGRQRKQIAEELRAHLEDRLDELVAQGVPHDEAVQQALSEFGDAAGLAASFAKVSRGRTRRWLMRVTTFSVAATLLIAAGIFTFWPGRNAAPGAAEAVAQAPAAAAPEPVAVGPADKTAAEKRDAAVDDVLKRRLDIAYKEVPLGEIAAKLTEQTGITFYLSMKKLDEAGVPLDSPITSTFRNIRLATWLDLALGELELTYMVRDDVIVITTPEDAESKLEVRIYDCRDLLEMPAPAGANKLVTPRRGGMGGMGGAMGGGMFAVQDSAPAAGSSGGGDEARGNRPASVGGSRVAGSEGDGQGQLTEHDVRVENLIEIIEWSVEPDSWDDVGGPGSVSEYNGLIVINQTAHVHAKVERLLDMLREAAGLQVPGKVVR